MNTAQRSSPPRSPGRSSHTLAARRSNAAFDTPTRARAALLLQAAHEGQRTPNPAAARSAPVDQTLRRQRWEDPVMGHDSLVDEMARPYPEEADRDAAFVRLGGRFDEALAFAAEMHREQARKGIPVP